MLCRDLKNQVRGTGAMDVEWPRSSLMDIFAEPLLNSSLVSGTTYTDTTAQAGQTYYYVSTAVNSSDQESAYSNEAQAVVPSP
jgi:TolB protein